MSISERASSSDAGNSNSNTCPTCFSVRIRGRSETFPSHGAGNGVPPSGGGSSDSSATGSMPSGSLCAIHSLRRTSFVRLNEWIAHKEPLGIDPVALLSDDPPPEGGTPLPAPWLGKVSDLPRILAEKQVGQVLLFELPASDEEARSLIDICQHHGCRLLIHNNLAERYTHPLVPTLEEGRHFYTLQEEPLEDPLN